MSEVWGKEGLLKGQAGFYEGGDGKFLREIGMVSRMSI
jgi:hypothetical protein